MYIVFIPIKNKYKSSNILSEMEKESDSSCESLFYVIRHYKKI